MVGESPVTYDARAIRPDHEGQVLNRKRLRSKGSYIQSIPRKARTPVVFSCWRTSLIAYSVVSRSTLIFNPWLFKSFRILLHLIILDLYFFFINVSLAPRPNFHKGDNWFSKPIGTHSPSIVSGSRRFVIRERHAYLGPGMTRPDLSSQKRPFVWSPDIRYMW